MGRLDTNMRAVELTHKFLWLADEMR